MRLQARGADTLTVVGVVRDVEATTARPTKIRWWMLSLFSLMYLISYLDRGIISVAQPEIRAQFGLSLSDMGLVLAAFTWAYAFGQVPAGWLGDRFGPRKVLTALLAFTSAAALMTGAKHAPTWLP